MSLFINLCRIPLRSFGVGMIRPETLKEDSGCLTEHFLGVACLVHLQKCLAKVEPCGGHVRVAFAAVHLHCYLEIFLVAFQRLFVLSHSLKDVALAAVGCRQARVVSATTRILISSDFE